MLQNKKCTVLGGGTAGWLTALFLKHYWPTVDVEVLEDPSKPPIIAGESGGAGLTELLRKLGVNIEEWARSVGATPKLGGTFTGWGGEDHSFYHALFSPFENKWLDKFGHTEHNRLFYIKALISAGIPLHDAVWAGPVMRDNRVPYNEDLENISGYDGLWHFDSRANADYLKKLGISHNIKLVEGTYTNADKDVHGNLTSLNLVDGRKIQSDWYFDCSGFARLLLVKEYNIPATDYSAFFPARAVVAWWDKPNYNSSTVATAMSAGWSWRIGLRKRTGQGYLYDPDELTKDQALEEAREKFGQHIEPVANLTFTPCMLTKHRLHNVFGVGLSTGFMEPLEANGVGMIVDALSALYSAWNPDLNPQDPELEKFNLMMDGAVENIRDFLLLHYRGKGLDTPFWRNMQDPHRVPDSIRDRLASWEEFYRTGKYDPIKYDNQFSPESWLTVIQGLNLIDPSIIDIKDVGPYAVKYCQEEKQRQHATQSKCIRIEEWIKRT